MKDLPKDLKYAFLGAERAQPVTIAAELTVEKEQKLIEILRKYKESIAWSVEDLKGISHLICMHKILLEENAKTSKKTEPSDERSCYKRGIEMVECRIYLCNLK